MTLYAIAQLKMTDRAAYDRYQARFFDVFRKFNGRLLSADESPSVVEGDWNRDKLVLMSFPDEAAYHDERIFRPSGNRLAARNALNQIVSAYSDRKTGIHFCGIRRWTRRNISKSRKTAKPARKPSGCSRRDLRRRPKQVRRYHHGGPMPGPKPTPNGNDADT
jgi:uncharacterized protein (DUF1330 family)